MRTPTRWRDRAQSLADRAQSVADRAQSRSDSRIVHQVASWCLSYPDDELLARVPLLDAALAEQPRDEATRALTRFLEHLSVVDPAAARASYVDVFDLSRRQTLYLTYWSDGDTRRRGEALGAFKQCYRDSGFLVDTHGELPDYLPMVLEFSARVDREAGRALLIENRPALELIRLSLAERDSPYADVMVAVCATLPGASPADKAAALALQTAGPATESVGLTIGGGAPRRLLPLYTNEEALGR